MTGKQMWSSFAPFWRTPAGFGSDTSIGIVTSNTCSSAKHLLVFLNDLLSQGNFCEALSVFFLVYISLPQSLLLRLSSLNVSKRIGNQWCIWCEITFFLICFTLYLSCFHISLSCLRFLSVFGKINWLEKQNCGRYRRGSSLEND